MADNRLYKSLNSAGYYTKSEEEFNKQFGTPEGQSKLYGALNSAGHYTKTEAEFKTQFFGEQPETETAQETVDYGLFDKATVEKYPQAKQNFERWQKENQPLKPLVSTPEQEFLAETPKPVTEIQKTVTETPEAVPVTPKATIPLDSNSYRNLNPQQAKEFAVQNAERQLPAQDSNFDGFGKELGKRGQRSGWSLNEMLANTPDFVNRVLVEAYNQSPAGKGVYAVGKVAEGLGLIKTAEDWKMKAADLKSDKANEYIENQKQILTSEIAKINPKHEMGIVEAAQQGDWTTFTRNLAGGVADSFAPSLAMMISGGSLGTAGMIGGGTAVFGAGKYAEMDKEAPDMDESTKVLAAATNGALEGVFETYLGSGAVGSAFMKVLAKNGRKAAQEVVEKSVRQSLVDLLIKHPALAPLGEGFEEMGTQISQNYIDKISGFRPNIGLMDGVFDAGLIGAFSGAVHSAPLYLAKATTDNSTLEQEPFTVGEQETPPQAPKTAREIQIDQKISTIQDNEGNVTKVEIDGQPFYVKNSEDLGNSGATIFVRDANGNTKPINSGKLTNWTKQTPEEVKTDIANEDAFLEAEKQRHEAEIAKAAEKGIVVGAEIENEFGTGTVTDINKEGVITAQDETGAISTSKIEETEPVIEKPEPEPGAVNIDELSSEDAFIELSKTDPKKAELVLRDDIEEARSAIAEHNKSKKGKGREERANILETIFKIQSEIDYLENKYFPKEEKLAESVKKNSEPQKKSTEITKTLVDNQPTKKLVEAKSSQKEKPTSEGDLQKLQESEELQPHQMSKEEFEERTANEEDLIGWYGSEAQKQADEIWKEYDRLQTADPKEFKLRKQEIEATANGIAQDWAELNSHENQLRKALSEGKAVYDGWQDDYPELAKQWAQQALSENQQINPNNDPNQAVLGTVGASPVATPELTEEQKPAPKKRKSPAITKEEQQARKERVSQALRIEPITLEQRILQHIVSGQRLNYTEIKNEVFPKSKRELDRRLWMLKGEAETIDNMRHIMNGLPFEEEGNEANVFRNAVLDVVLTFDSHKAMVDRIFEIGTEKQDNRKDENDYYEGLAKQAEVEEQAEIESIWENYVDNSISEDELINLYLDYYEQQENIEGEVQGDNRKPINGNGEIGTGSSKGAGTPVEEQKPEVAGVVSQEIPLSIPESIEKQQRPKAENTTITNANQPAIDKLKAENPELFEQPPVSEDKKEETSGEVLSPEKKEEQEPVEEEPKYTVPESFNLQSFAEFNKLLDNGEITIDEFKQAFAAVKASKDIILSELNGKTKAELLSNMSSMGQYRYKNEKKDSIVKALYTDHLMTFSFGMISYDFSSTIEQAIEKKVANTTQEDIDNYVAETKQRRADYIAQLEKRKKALTNPETLEEFKIFIDRKGIAALTPEQKTVYDDLVTDKVIDKRKEAAENKAIVEKVELGDTKLNIIESKNTKTGEDIWVVRLSDRVERSVYDDLNGKAKKLGGYYSSYRGNGAIPGFIFKSKDQAQKFVNLQKEDVSNIDKAEERQEEKIQNRAAKLRENAEKIIERVDAELNRDRLTNTARRASQAASTEARLADEKRIAQTMLNIANAIDNGDVKLLDGIKAKTHIELLDMYLRSAKRDEVSAKYKNANYDERRSKEQEPPTIESVEYLRFGYYPNIYGSTIKDLLNKSEDNKGVKLIAARWRKKIASLGEYDSYQITTDLEIQDITDLFNSLTEYERKYNRIDEILKNHNRLKSMGIENDSMLRAALREYVQFRGKNQEVDKIKQLERALVGNKNLGIDFFPTPMETARIMVDEAGIAEGMDVLEPSAGNGNIADAIKETGVMPDVIEISSKLAEVLEAKGYDVVATDFMEYSGRKYDRIVMNPPFSNGMDGEHVQHAYELLKPGGKIVAIVGEGTFIRSDKKAVAFREWLDEVGGTEEKLESGTFQDKKLLNTTGANARLVIIDKPIDTIEEKQEGDNTVLFRIIGETGAANLDKAEREERLKNSNIGGKNFNIPTGMLSKNSMYILDELFNKKGVQEFRVNVPPYYNELIENGLVLKTGDKSVSITQNGKIYVLKSKIKEADDTLSFSEEIPKTLEESYDIAIKLFGSNSGGDNKYSRIRLRNGKTIQLRVSDHNIHTNPQTTDNYILPITFSSNTFSHIKNEKFITTPLSEKQIFNYIKSEIDKYGEIDNLIERQSPNIINIINQRKNDLIQLKEIINSITPKAEEATTRLDNLRVAKEMEESGKEPKQILLATGWQRGADGKWRYEVPDGKLKDGWEEMHDDDTAQTLSEVWDDPELFKAYPQLKDVYIGALSDQEETMEGSYHPQGVDGKPTIYAGGDGVEQMTSTLIHEIQHIVQDLEGFARGGNVNDMALRDKLSSAGVQNKEQLQEKIKQLKKEYQRIYNEWERKAFGKRYKGQIAETHKLLREWRDIEDGIKELESNKYDYDKAFSLYEKLAGEVESRNVQTRMDYTPEQRRQALLEETEDVSRKDQIFIYDSLGARLEEEANPETIEVSDKSNPDIKQRTNAINALNALVKQFGVPISVIHSSELSDVVGLAAKRKKGTPVAFYHNGTAYIISDQITSVSDVKQSYLHEAILHKGLDLLFSAGPVTVLGKKYNTKNELLDEVYSRLSPELISEIAKDYTNGEAKTTQQQREIAEEALARLNELEITPPRLEVFMDSLWKFIKKLVGFSSKQFTRTELHKMLSDHRKQVQKLARGGITESSDPKLNSTIDFFARIGESKQDRSGNYIGDGSFHSYYSVSDFSKYPQIKSKVSKSDTTESVYVTYSNTENGKSVTVRFSEHENNATKFGDQLDSFASDNEILYKLGLKTREFIPAKYLMISSRQIAKKDLGNYEESDKTIKELYNLGADADISKHKGKLAKNSNYLILDDKVTEHEEKGRGPFGESVRLGKYEYFDLETDPMFRFRSRDPEVNKVLDNLEEYKKTGVWIPIAPQKPTVTPPKPPVKKAETSQSGGKTVDKTIVTKRTYEGDFVDAIDRELEKKGLTRETQNQKEAEQIGLTIIEMEGLEGALNRVRSGEIGGAPAGAIWHEKLKDIDSKMNAETNPEMYNLLAKEYADITEEMGNVATLSGQFSAFFNYIYNTSDLGFNAERLIRDYKLVNNGEISPELEAKFRKLAADFKEVQEKLAAEQLKVKELEEQAAVEAIKASIERQNKRKSKASDKIREKTDKLVALIDLGKLNRPGVFSAATPGSLAWDLGLETVKTAVKATGRTIEAIAKGWEAIKSTDWYKGLDAPKQRQARNAYYDFFTSQDDKKDKEGKEIPTYQLTKNGLKIPHAVIRDLVEQGMGNIDDLTQAVYDIIIEDLPEITIREVRDAITGYGDTMNQNQEEIEREIRKMKDLGRVISGLEDVAEGERPKKSGLQRDKPDPDTRAAHKQLREAMKLLPVDEQRRLDQQKTQLDTAKQRLINQIEDLQREIDKGELTPKNARTMQEDDELRQLRAARDAKKAEHAALFNDEEFLNKKRVELSKKAVNRRIAEFEKRISEGNFAPKERKELIADTELIRLRAEKLRIQEEYKKEMFKAKLRNRTQAEKVKDGLWDAWGITRALRATGEFSFVGIQGLINTIAHPIQAKQAFKTSMRFLTSQRKADDWMNTLKAQDYYAMLKESKLAITEPNAELTAREELFYSGWTDMIWNNVGKILGKDTDSWMDYNPLRAIERAAVGYLDTQRVLRYLDGVEMLKEKGIEFSQANKQAYVEMADVINTFTGRGSIGRLDPELLTKIFFSPRNWSSVIKTATPYAFYHFGKKRAGAEAWKPSVAQKMALSDFSKFVALTASLVALAAVALNGDDDENKVELDPRSTDFGKIKIGDVRIDPWGGRIQQIVLISRLLSGDVKNSYGEVTPIGTPYKSPTGAELLIQMATNKLSPSASILYKHLSAKVDADGNKVDTFGEPYSLPGTLKENLYPIYWETLSELAKDDITVLDGVLAAYAFFGGGVNIYDQTPEKMTDRKLKEQTLLKSQFNEKIDAGYKLTKDDEPKYNQAIVSSRLKQQYVVLKTRATRYEKEGNEAAAERIRLLIEESKLKLNEADYDYNTLLKESDRLKQIIKPDEN